MKIFLMIMAVISFLLMMVENNDYTKKVFGICFVILTFEITFLAVLPYFVI